MTQGALFPTPKLSYQAARRARDKSLALVASSDRFMARAALAIEIIARRQATLIVDDVWTQMPETPTTTDKRAMGAAMMAAVKANVISRTDTYRPSAQVQCHANPRRVWKSELYWSFDGD